jgi:predicted Zn finger-like uncharacterized protein
MAKPSPASVVIACPQCGTRYRLPRESLGAGREVQCANCQTAWQPALAALDDTPSPPAPVPAFEAEEVVGALAESSLDAAFVAEEQAVLAEAPPAPRPTSRSIADIKAAIAPKLAPAVPDEDALPDEGLLRKRMRAFARRQDSLRRRLPTGRLRRIVRLATALVLVAIVGAGLFLRTTIVRAFPDLAGIYEGIGLPVNVVGLQFREVRTLETLENGVNVLVVGARIMSVSGDPPVPVPQVVVTLLNDEGEPVYEWSVAPPAHDLGPGEGVDFETRLTQPPADGKHVRLAFASDRTQSDSPPADIGGGR